MFCPISHFLREKRPRQDAQDRGARPQTSPSGILVQATHHPHRRQRLGVAPGLEERQDFVREKLFHNYAKNNEVKVLSAQRFHCCWDLCTRTSSQPGPFERGHDFPEKAGVGLDNHYARRPANAESVVPALYVPLLYHNPSPSRTTALSWPSPSKRIPESD